MVPNSAIVTVLNPYLRDSQSLFLKGLLWSSHTNICSSLLPRQWYGHQVRELCETVPSLVSSAIITAWVPPLCEIQLQKLYIIKTLTNPPVRHIRMHDVHTHTMTKSPLQIKAITLTLQSNKQGQNLNKLILLY